MNREEGMKLPTLSIHGDLDIKELYSIIEGIRCRRCGGVKFEPGEEYPCLLCRGTGIEKFPTGSFKVCSKHPKEKLVAIGKRHVEWEDAMGFSCQGYIEVKGCPKCKVPVYSVKQF